MKTKIDNFFNVSTETKQLYIKPFAFLHALFAVICILYPIVICIAAVEEKIYTWPAKIILAFVLIFIISSLTIIWSSFQWWSSYKKLTSISIAENGPIAGKTIAVFLRTLSKFLGVAIGISGTFTLIVCSLVFSDAEFYEILEGFNLDILTSINLHRQGLIGVKMQGVIMFPIIIYLFMFVLKLFSELFNFISNDKSNN